MKSSTRNAANSILFNWPREKQKKKTIFKKKSFFNIIAADVAHVVVDPFYIAEFFPLSNRLIAHSLPSHVTLK